MQDLKLGKINCKIKKGLLKLSGELFSEQEKVLSVMEEIRELTNSGIKLALLIGGGNIMRGKKAQNLDRVIADRIGMLGTLINGLYLEDICEKLNIPVVHYSAVSNPWIPPYNPLYAQRDLRNGKLLLLSGGTGNPFFTTDTAAILRAIELKMDVVIKGTKVKGVYAEDPAEHPDAKFLPEITYEEAIKRNLGIMDRTALVLAKEYHILNIVLNIYKKNNLKKALKNEEFVGTIIKEENGRNI